MRQSPFFIQIMMIGGGAAEAGDISAGGAYQASSGVGFFSGNQGGSIGAFTNSGGFAGLGTSDQFVLGSSAGLGSGAFWTNAGCAKELLGPFDTWSFNIPLISFQYATSGSTKIASFEIGRSWGFSFSRYSVTSTSAF